MTPLRRQGLAMALAVFVIDQFVKWLVTGPLGIREAGDTMELVPAFDLTFVANYGISLGLFPANSAGGTWALIAVTFVIACAVSWWMWKETERGDVLALGAVLGGALGNIVDRARLGYVVDYADLHFGTFRPFFIFNVADAAISIGALALVLRAFVIRRKPAVTETNDA